VFDSWLETYLRVVEDRAAEEQMLRWPPAAEAWPDFIAWFIDRVTRIGSDPIPFVFPTRRFDWLRLRARWETSLNGPARYGWFVPWESPTPRSLSPSTAGLAVFDDVTVYRASSDGFLEDMESAPASVAGEDADYIVIVVSMLRTVAEWRSPMIPPDQAWTVVVDEDGLVTSDERW
jgi:hypothetical protein